jgi:4-alpha-glucanotransferase
MMGDDGEKFGAWPTTWEHCWGKRDWVERFFTALEVNTDWLATTTPSAWLDGHAPIGRVYVPTGSYAEMGEWALPPAESVVYADLLHHAQAEHRPEARWLRGAFWRNFQVRYREINDLHKRMLRVSDAVAAMPAGPARDRAVDHLYRGQSNDCYWHGLFGGIYLSHMRLATHAHLIAAEDLADTGTGSQATAERLDLDLDGHDEVRLADVGQVVTVDLDKGAGIGAWDILAVRHALAAVMRRRPEAYHAKLRHLDDHRAKTGRADSERGSGATVAASIHEAIRVKEPGLASLLVYDAYERRSGLVRALSQEATADDWASARATELGDAIDGAFDLVDLRPGKAMTRRAATIAGASIEVTKTVTLSGDRRRPALTLRLDLDHRAGPSIEARIGLEWALTMLGGGANPAAWWDVEGTRHAHDGRGTATGIATIAQGNDDVGVSVTSAFEPADAWWAPIETVSNSEDGFERVYQGSALLVSWPVHLASGGRWSRTIQHVVATAADRREGES